MLRRGRGAAVPVHDVGGEGGGEAQHVEAELGGRAQGQAGHDGEEGQVHPQACETMQTAR